MQNYNNSANNESNNNDFNCHLLLKLNLYQLKLLLKHGIFINDVNLVPMYEEYLEMRKNGLKVVYILAYLSEKYSQSESTIRRVIRRFSRHIDLE